MSKQKINSKQLKQKLQFALEKLQKYTIVMFIIVVAGLYGVVILHIQTLRSAQPSEESVSSQVSAAKIPHIDEALVNKLQSLHDNSVSVQSLFDQARSNPFKE